MVFSLSAGLSKPFIVVVTGVLVLLGAIGGSSSQPSQNTNKASSGITKKLQPKPYTFPAGGRTIFPKYRLVGLYGTPSEPLLGVLGQQSLKDSVKRVKKLAADYQKYSKETILPTFEIITTIASASPTKNGDYSRELTAASLRPWVEAAKQNGIYVVLDLQPGRTDFLAQAKEYQPLLDYPNVGLALDPEWRLKPDQVPLVQIGSVGIDEINATSAWLSQLTHANNLPQKLFLLHEFRLNMITDRNSLNTSHADLAFAIQMDGQGAQKDKLDTYKVVTADPPKHVYFGWKNFYEKDSPMRSVQDTMALSPEPWYISYQ